MGDTLPDVATAWTAAFRLSNQALSESVDAPRFRAAFKALLPKVREWPAPAEILDLLPNRPPQRVIDEGPTVTPEQRAENLRLLRELSAGLLGTRALAHDHHNERARAEAHARAREE